MAYNGGRGGNVNVSEYINQLNTLPAAQDEHINFEDDLALFTDVNFQDWDVIENGDIQQTFDSSRNNSKTDFDFGQGKQAFHIHSVCQALNNCLRIAFRLDEDIVSMFCFLSHAIWVILFRPALSPLSSYLPQSDAPLLHNHSILIKGLNASFIGTQHFTNIPLELLCRSLQVFYF